MLLRKPNRPVLDREYWIFDLDGTLTVPVHDFPAIRKELGIPDGIDILKHILCQDKLTAEALLQKLDAIEIKLADLTRPAAGVRDLLAILNAKGVRFGIITRNTRENARRSLAKIGVLSYFSDECILGRDQAPPKPDPGGILHLLAIWNTLPGQAVMVGDYLFDLQAGKSAGTATIHVNRNEEKAWKDLTDIYVSSLAEIVGLITTGDSIAHPKN
jgi:HAD superfamily hydrolase (TIGR01509 family)